MHSATAHIVDLDSPYKSVTLMDVCVHCERPLDMDPMGRAFIYPTSGAPAHLKCVALGSVERMDAYIVAHGGKPKVRY